MDWSAFILSLELAAATTLVLIPVSMLLARFLAWKQFMLKGVVEALVALPLVLPPTVLGYYLLVSFGANGWLGQWYTEVFGHSLAFSFTGLLLASLIFNLPFAVQPMQRGFEGVSREVRESAWCCGLSRWRTFWRIELPLARNGVVGAALLTFAHTLGEFGVVLMVGGNIPGQTRTVSIAIFDRVEAFDDASAGMMSAMMLVFALLVIGCVFSLNRLGRRAF